MLTRLNYPINRHSYTYSSGAGNHTSFTIQIIWHYTELSNKISFVSIPYSTVKHNAKMRERNSILSIRYTCVFRISTIQIFLTTSTPLVQYKPACTDGSFISLQLLHKPSGSRAHTASYTMGTGSSPASSAEVKERVELHFYSACRPLWPVLG